MIYGYARVSTKTQNIERQIENLTKEGAQKIIREKFTGTRIEGRVEFKKLIKIVSKGDTIIFDSVSRMSRDSIEGVRIYFELLERGVNLKFIKEPMINSEVYDANSNTSLEPIGEEIADEYIKATNRVLKIIAEKQIKIAFNQSEKEIKDLKIRTKEGIKIARAKGKQIGNIKGTTFKTKQGEAYKAKLLRHHRAFNGTMTDREFMDAYKGSKTTLVKYKRKIREEIENQDI